MNTQRNEDCNEISLEPYDIYIVGTGIIPAFYLTREAEIVIRRSKEVLYLDKSFGIEEFLKSLCPNIRDLHAVTYQEGAQRMGAYREMASLVTEAALDHPPITFALYRHPLVYSLPPFIVINAAYLLGLHVKVLPGISSLDALLVDLGFDPCTQGLQMYEATDLLLRRRPLQPDVPCFIWQIGTVESRLYTEAASKPERFTRLKKYLLQFYPPTHKILAVHSSSIPLAPTSIEECELINIEEVANKLHQGVTVFIPPINTRQIEERELLESMDNVAYLDKFTFGSPKNVPRQL